MTTDIKARLCSPFETEIASLRFMAHDRIVELEKQLAEASKDAARYRAIRDFACDTVIKDGVYANRFVEAGATVIKDRILTPDLYDAAIDAAMQSQNKENQHEQ